MSGPTKEQFDPSVIWLALQQATLPCAVVPASPGLIFSYMLGMRDPTLSLWWNAGEAGQDSPSFGEIERHLEAGQRVLRGLGYRVGVRPIWSVADFREPNRFASVDPGPQRARPSSVERVQAESRRAANDLQAEVGEDFLSYYVRSLRVQRRPSDLEGTDSVGACLPPEPDYQITTAPPPRPEPTLRDRAIEMLDICLAIDSDEQEREMAASTLLDIARPSMLKEFVALQRENARLHEISRDSSVQWVEHARSPVRDAFVRCLNRAYGADPVAIHSLLCNRVPCRQALVDDPTVVCSHEPVVRHLANAYSVSALGLLNGLLAEAGLGPIGIQFSDHDDELGRGGCHVFAGFVAAELTLETVPNESARLVADASLTPEDIDILRSRFGSNLPAQDHATTEPTQEPAARRPGVPCAVSILEAEMHEPDFLTPSDLQQMKHLKSRRGRILPGGDPS